MKFDVAVMAPTLSQARELAISAEKTGFDTLWTSETQHDPFLPLGVAALETGRIGLGTAIAVAFARNPMSLAYLAWDLQQASNGRFILGLGTQVKAHIERRFGMPWSPPAARLREMIEAIQAIWNCWQHGTKLNYRGQFFKLTLMAPFFNPGPIDHPDIPIYIAGVNPLMCQLAGELCQGLHVHPFHTTRYIRETILANVQKGLDESKRERSEIELSSTVFVITGQTEKALARSREEVRSQVSFYASTPSYRVVMDLHGWGDVGEALSRLAIRQRWAEMPAMISDEMLSQFAITGSPETLPALVQARYEGLLDRVTFYLPFDLKTRYPWQQWVEDFARREGASRSVG